MECYESKHIDASVVQLMAAIRNKYIQQGKEYTNNYLLIQEKLIYTLIAYLHHNHQHNIDQQFPDIQELIITFVHKVNKMTMQHLEQNIQKDARCDQKLLNKAISLLMLPQASKRVENEMQFKKLKILSFNNLSCIYKKKKKFGIALRAINYAVKLEEELLGAQVSQEKYDIVPAYLNKAAIYSQMKKHSEAMETVLKAREHIQQIEKELTVQIENTVEESEKKRLLQKRYYGMYMKMIIFYNMAAEKEHLRLKVEALEYYKQSKQVAIIINNQLMINKLSGIIEGIM